MRGWGLGGGVGVWRVCVCPSVLAGEGGCMLEGVLTRQEKADRSRGRAFLRSNPASALILGVNHKKWGEKVPCTEKV